jgi:hypothetical protein
MKSYACLLGVIYLASFGAPLPAQTAPGEDFKSKALAEWNALLERINSVRGEKHLELHSTGFHPSLDGVRPRLQHTETHRYLCSRAGLRAEQELGEVDESGKTAVSVHSIFLRNEEYSAELKRARKGDGWLLSELKMGDQNSDFEKLALHFGLPWLVLFDYTVRVPEWLQRPSFVITRIEKIHGGTIGQITRTHFRYDGSPMQDPEPPHPTLSERVVSGYVDFDDRRFYRIMGYSVHFTGSRGDDDCNGDFVYEESGGIPMLKIITEDTPKSYLKDHGWMSGKTITKYQYSYDAPPSAEEFRLSHYELPEPLGVAPLPKSHAYLWIALGAVTAAVIAIFFNWMARRRRNTQIARS